MKGFTENPGNKLGKVIEENVKESLRLAGVEIKTSGDLDHNHKIDFVIKLNNEDVGVQFSLGGDRLDRNKPKVAKICALDAVPRFIYLSTAKEFFERPDKRNGKDLFQFLGGLVEQYSDEALSVNIDRRGVQVNAL